MARRRTIDPELWHDSRFLKLASDRCKLLYIGLVSLADDEGIVELDLELIRHYIFDSRVRFKDIAGCLDTIESVGLLVRYSSFSGKFAFLPDFPLVQYIQKPKETRLPRPPDELKQKFPHYFNAIKNRSYDTNTIPIQSPYNSAGIDIYLARIYHRNISRCISLGKIREFIKDALTCNIPPSILEKAFYDPANKGLKIWEIIDSLRKKQVRQGAPLLATDFTRNDGDYERIERNSRSGNSH